jgi:hypothetical protein
VEVLTWRGLVTYYEHPMKRPNSTHVYRDRSNPVDQADDWATVSDPTPPPPPRAREIDIDAKDLRSQLLDEADCEFAREQLTADILSIEAQLEEAQEHQRRTGQYADAHWFRRAKAALRWKRLTIQQVQEHKAKLRRAGKPLDPEALRNRCLVALLRAEDKRGPQQKQMGAKRPIKRPTHQTIPFTPLSPHTPPRASVGPPGAVFVRCRHQQAQCSRVVVHRGVGRQVGQGFTRCFLLRTALHLVLAKM